MPEWEPLIRKGFIPTGDELVFGDISPDSAAGFDLVVPLDIQSLRQMAGNRACFTRNPIPLPSTECIELCADKLLLNHKLHELGFGSLVPAIGRRDYPYILKKRSGEWSRDCHLIEDAFSEQAYSMHLGDPDYFTQEMIEGSKEYATHILVKDARIAVLLNIEYGYAGDRPIKGKDVVTSLRSCDCPFRAEFESLLAAIGFEGLCCLNYKVRNGRPLLLEINPRFGGSLAPHFASFIEMVA